MQLQVFYFDGKLSIFKKGGKLSHCSESMDSTQSRLDFESKEGMDSLDLPLCARQGLQVKFCYSSQSSRESLVLTL